MTLSDTPLLIRVAAEPARQEKVQRIDVDLVIVGAGMAGVCCAITAARAGLTVALAQDRPVPGGNASSEVRLWVLGATCHMGSNNRWAREGGVIDEILVENLYRNPEGNPLIFDTIVLEKIIEEPNITLLLNTSVFEAAKTPGDPDTLASVRGFCSQNSTFYELFAPLFCDASGDGILGFLCGAAFRMGAEAKEEFDEPYAPGKEFGGLLGDSIYFYSKDAHRPVKFVPPSFAMKNVPERIPRYRQFNAQSQGCRLWWIEYGGRLDTVHQAEQIKWELWKIVYGVWDYIKNSGQFPDAENLTLEWVGHIPGKRESRRFEGDYILTQKDIVHRPNHDDAVAFGGWSIDLHPADGVYSKLAGSHHLHSKGPYQIPYRCLYSRNVRNLFFAGRLISASHVAFGTIRVMGTGAHCGQAVALAAAICKREKCRPADVVEPARMRALQRDLMCSGQHLPGRRLEDPRDIARQAKITASSEFVLGHLPDNAGAHKLDRDAAQLIPVLPGAMPRVTLWLDVTEATELRIELRTTSRVDHHTPDVTLGSVTRRVAPGERIPLEVAFDVTIDQPRYVFLLLLKNPAVSVRCTERRITGLLTLVHSRDEKTSPVGGEDYEIWVPARRPNGHNFAMEVAGAISAWAPENLCNGVQRPTSGPNAWTADPDDARPSITLVWPALRRISRVELFFDVDYDHAMESCLMGHPERTVPFCAKAYRLTDRGGRLLAERADNHQARQTLNLDPSFQTDQLRLEILEMNSAVCCAAVMEIRCYE